MILDSGLQTVSGHRVYNVGACTHTGVRVGVFLHVGFLVERLAAERAMERPHVAVDQQVRAQR